MKISTAFISFLILAPSAFASDTPAKPKLKVAPDGFPSGHETPEGAACDLARAFINKDFGLFNATCIKPFGSGENRTDYEKFMESVKTGMASEAAKKEPSPGGPKCIARVFAARHLSMSGPASAGYAMFDFRDIQFVDIVTKLQNDQESLTRILVIQTPDLKWFVHPAPATASILSMGLNGEKASTQDFSEAYEIQK